MLQINDKKLQTELTQAERGWGSGPTPDYDQIAAPFRPIFAEIEREAVRRDLERDLPFDAVNKLKAAGFGAVRLPADVGGKGGDVAGTGELADRIVGGRFQHYPDPARPFRLHRRPLELQDRGTAQGLVRAYRSRRDRRQCLE
jgi:hypothetical protein